MILGFTDGNPGYSSEHSRNKEQDSKNKPTEPQAPTLVRGEIRHRPRHQKTTSVPKPKKNSAPNQPAHQKVPKVRPKSPSPHRDRVHQNTTPGSKT